MRFSEFLSEDLRSLFLSAARWKTRRLDSSTSQLEITKSPESKIFLLLKLKIVISLSGIFV